MIFAKVFLWRKTIRFASFVHHEQGRLPDERSTVRQWPEGLSTDNEKTFLLARSTYEQHLPILFASIHKSICWVEHHSLTCDSRRPDPRAFVSTEQNPLRFLYLP